MKVYLISIFLLFSCCSTFTKIVVDNLNYSFSGYIKYESFWDTRQVFGDTVDQFLIFPEKKDPDPLGNDRNAIGQSNMAAFETRMNLLVDGLQFNNANAKSVIEADFFGALDMPNILRLRLAYAQLDWPNISLLVGQTWHPIGPEEIVAESISFNAGNPFDLYARSPQITFTYHNPTIEVILSALTQIDFLSDGPNGLRTEYIRNAVIPNLHGQLRWHFNGHVAGTGIDYKRLVPRIKTNTNFKVRESLSSVAAIWYFALEYPKIQIHSKLNFGQNVSDYGVIGGYAVKKKSIDPITDERKYTNIRTVSFWSDIIIKNLKRYEPGVLIGIAKNVGSSKEIEQNLTNAQGTVIERRIFGTGNDIDTIFRIAPRLRVKYNKVTVAGEIEYTRAAFGQITDKGKVINTIPVANVRFLFAVFYNF